MRKMLMAVEGVKKVCMLQWRACGRGAPSLHNTVGITKFSNGQTRFYYFFHYPETVQVDIMYLPLYYNLLG
jgi:hypothetical protein